MQKKKLLLFIITGGLGLLFLFKYLNRTNENTKVIDSPIAKNNFNQNTSQRTTVTPNKQDQDSILLKGPTDQVKSSVNLANPIRAGRPFDNFQDIEKDFKDKHPNKKFKFNQDFSSQWSRIKGDELPEYADMEVQDAAQKFLEDHPELLGDLPEGAQITDLDIKQNATNYAVVLSTYFEGSRIPGTKVLFFKKGEGTKSGPFYEMNNSIPPIRSVKRCNNVTQEDAQIYVQNSYQNQKIQIKRTFKEWLSAANSSIIPVWVIEFSLTNTEGEFQNYLAKVSICDLSFAERPHTTDKH